MCSLNDKLFRGRKTGVTSLRTVPSILHSPITTKHRIAAYHAARFGLFSTLFRNFGIKQGGIIIIICNEYWSFTRKDASSQLAR
jgi:hypothetical protein